jgi:hypothetical protein
LYSGSWLWNVLNWPFGPLDLFSCIIPLISIDDDCVGTG